MREYILYFEDTWWHFFIKPFYGLCYRKREGGRFLNLEVLLPDAVQDFSVLALSKELHVICQDKSGNILHLVYEGGTWNKSVLLSSKTENSYPKYFSLVNLGGYINLFYVIVYQEKHMLVHQILNLPDKPPAVIDRIPLASPPYLVANTVGTDLLVLYQNEKRESCFRIYRWSKKEFSRAMPLNPEIHPSVVSVLPEPDGAIHFAALAPAEAVQNLVYFKQNDSLSFTECKTIYLDIEKDALPVFCRHEGKLYLVWKERGSILSSYLSSDGNSWSKPLRYVKNTGRAPILYCVASKEGSSLFYGYEKEQDIILYPCITLDSLTPQQKTAASLLATIEREDFSSSGTPVNEFSKSTQNPLYLQLKEEISGIKDQIFSLKTEVLRMQNLFSVLKTEENLAEDDGAIDDILLEQSRSFETNF